MSEAPESTPELEAATTDSPPTSAPDHPVDLPSDTVSETTAEAKVESKLDEAVDPQDRVKQLEAEGDLAADYLEELLDIADLDGDIDMDVEGDRAAVSVVGA